MEERNLIPYIDRSRWPAGPWSSEPDRWEDRYRGFPVLAVRSIGSHHWCGYVGLPSGHRWLADPALLESVEVHGGLTYGPSPCHPPVCHVPRPGEPDDVRWIGFDCGHAGDLTPGWARFGGPLASQGIYRTLEYVQAQVRALADQAAAAAP